MDCIGLQQIKSSVLVAGKYRIAFRSNPGIVKVMVIVFLSLKTKIQEDDYNNHSGHQKQFSSCSHNDGSKFSLIRLKNSFSFVSFDRISLVQIRLDNYVHLGLTG